MPTHTTVAGVTICTAWRHFGLTLELRVDQGPKRSQYGDEQGSHPARERYQSLVLIRNGDNTYGIFSKDKWPEAGDDAGKRYRGRRRNN